MPEVKKDWKDSKGTEIVQDINDSFREEFNSFLLNCERLVVYLNEVEKQGEYLTSWRGELCSTGGWLGVLQAWDRVGEFASKRIGRLGTGFASMP